MYSYVANRLLLCCPQGSFLLPWTRNYPTYSNDDEFEKYEPRPRIIIDDETLSVSSLNVGVNDSIDEDDDPSLRVNVQYSSLKKTVLLKIVCIRLNSCESEKFLTNPKQQTRSLPLTSVVVYGDVFSFTAVNQESLLNSVIQFRVYVSKNTHKARATLKAECSLPGDDIPINSAPTPFSLAINFLDQVKSELAASLSPSMHRVSNGGSFNGDSRRSSMVDSCGRFCSIPNNESSELQVSLCFEPSQQCLKVVAEKGSQFGDKAKPPDTFVRIAVLGARDNELQKCKSETCKASNEPVYNYSTAIKMSRGDLDLNNVRVEVWQSSGVLKRRQLIGMVQLGINASSPDAQEHWEQMIQGQGITVSKWHVLQKSL